jgi:hypothetical protein
MTPTQVNETGENKTKLNSNSQMQTSPFITDQLKEEKEKLLKLKPIWVPAPLTKKLLLKQEYKWTNC